MTESVIPQYHPARLIIRNIISAVLIAIDVVALIPAIPGALIFIISAWIYSMLDDWAMPDRVHSKSQETAACWRYLTGKP